MDNTFTGNKNRAVTRKGRYGILCPHEICSVIEEYPSLHDLPCEVEQHLEFIPCRLSKQVNPATSKQGSRFTVEARHTFVLGNWKLNNH